MSEFKFACPVCGQHMMCDVSQGGSVMECPTCFQKIVAPQAPAPDAKFILTGTKLTEKKVLVRGAEAPTMAPKKKYSIAALLFVLVLILATGAGLYFFKARLLGPHYTWQSVDIGNVSKPGSFTEKDGKFTITGAGVDIWSEADAFHFAWVKLNGDAGIEARVLNMKRTDPWAKAGVMFRDSLKPDSRFALAAVTPASGVTYQTRTETRGAASAVIITPNVNAPYWLRLKRQGSTFTAFSSADGSKWTEMGSKTISMGRQIYAGLAVCSHNEGELCQAQFSNVSLSGQIASEAETTNAPAGAPALVAPPASDTNWTLSLDTISIPDATVVGRIHGQDFILERAIYTPNGLTLRKGQHGPVELGVSIDFGGAPPETLENQTLNIAPDADKAARVTLRWKDASGALQKEDYDDKYALRLEFGKIGRGRLPGKIYLCTPDAEKSYLMGKFTASISRPKPKP